MEIEISNGCVFQAIPASARASRGKAVVAIIQDELAFSIEGDANRGAKGHVRRPFAFHCTVW